MERIARRASVNKAALYYHVGGKEVLFGRVLMDVFPDIRELISGELDEAEGAIERMTAYIRMLANIISVRESASNILLSEMARGFKSMPQEVVVRVRELYFIYQTIITEGKDEGVFSKDFHPNVGHAMAMGGLLIIKAGRGILNIQAGSGFSYQPQMFGSSYDELTEEVIKGQLSAMVVK